MDTVQTKFTLDKVQWVRKVLFKAITVGEGYLTPVCTQLQIKGGRALRAGMWREGHWPSMFANWLYQKGKYTFISL